MTAPHELDGAQVVRYAKVTETVTPTGATHHTVGGTLWGPAAALAIAHYPDTEGYHLLYLADNGNVVTDTWHESIQAAFDQAAFEYEGLDWTAISPP